MTTTEAPTISETTADLLAAALRKWWRQERQAWDEAVEGDTEEDLWDGMPEVDSKAIARSSPVFEELLNTPLDVKLIRRGGYPSIDEAISDLVPQMMAIASKNP